MAAVLAFAKSIGFEGKNTALGTTSYVVEDKSANLVDTVSQISDIPILLLNSNLQNQNILDYDHTQKDLSKKEQALEVHLLLVC